MSTRSIVMTRLRRALALIIAGLVVQLVCILAWSPASFIAFAVLGVGLVVVGVGWFVLGAWREADAHVAEDLATDGDPTS